MNELDRMGIYKIVNTETNDFYIGSTFLSLDQRMQTYKSEYKRGLKKKLFDCMNKHGGIQNFEYLLIDTIQSDNRNELIDLEREWQLKLKPTLNTNVAGGSDKNRKRILKRRSKNEQSNEIDI